MKTTNNTNDYKTYNYKGLTPNEEYDVIGYALIVPGSALEDGTEIENKCVATCLNSAPLKDKAAIIGIKEKLFISPIHYSSQGNYLGDEQEWFMPVDLNKMKNKED
jgi:hypothetical protein